MGVAGVEMQRNRGATWESGLTPPSAQVTGNLGGHGLPGHAVFFDAATRYQILLHQFQVPMTVIYLKSLGSFQRSFGRDHEGGGEERPVVCSPSEK